ncbi:MAG: site-specific integrase [Zetaproteobacteria bacterium]|nr:site-specific integrase [Zetaproteobacteria bacterium]
MVVSIKKNEHILSFSTSLLQSGKKPATVSAYIADIKGFLHYIEQIKVSMENCDPSILFYYQQNLSEQQKHPNSIRRKLIAVRLFYRHLNEKNSKKYAPLEEAIIPGRNESLQVRFTTHHFEECIHIFDAQSPNIKILRDQAIFCLLCLEGAKSSEIIRLTPQDFVFAENIGSLRILGERRRIIALCDRTSKSIQNYIYGMSRYYPKTMYPHVYQNLFVSFRGKHLDNPSKTLSRHGIKFMIYELGEMIGISQLNSEELRHHAIQYHLQLGKKASEIREHFGLKRNGLIAKHASPSSNSLNLNTNATPHVISSTTDGTGYESH